MDTTNQVYGLVSGVRATTCRVGRSPHAELLCAEASVACESVTSYDRQCQESALAVARLGSAVPGSLGLKKDIPMIGSVG